MSDGGDTTQFVGGPITRYGGKGQNAPLIVPHLPRALAYAEPFFGADSSSRSPPERMREK